jgi:hypothetical protein
VGGGEEEGYGRGGAAAEMEFHAVDDGDVMVWDGGGVEGTWDRCSRWGVGEVLELWDGILL